MSNVDLPTVSNFRSATPNSVYWFTRLRQGPSYRYAVSLVDGYSFVLGLQRLLNLRLQDHVTGGRVRQVVRGYDRSFDCRRGTAAAPRCIEEDGRWGPDTMNALYAVIGLMNPPEAATMRSALEAVGRGLRAGQEMPIEAVRVAIWVMQSFLVAEGTTFPAHGLRDIVLPGTDTVGTTVTPYWMTEIYSASAREFSRIAMTWLPPEWQPVPLGVAFVPGAIGTPESTVASQGTPVSPPASTPAPPATEPTPGTETPPTQDTALAPPQLIPPEKPVLEPVGTMPVPAPARAGINWPVVLVVAAGAAVAVYVGKRVIDSRSARRRPRTGPTGTLVS